MSSVCWAHGTGKASRTRERAGPRAISQLELYTLWGDDGRGDTPLWDRSLDAAPGGRAAWKAQP
jgi:hypothetical protein